MNVEDIRRANFGAFAGLDRGSLKILQVPGKRKDGVKAEGLSNTEPPLSPSSLDGASSLGEFEKLLLDLDGSSDTTLQPSSPGVASGTEEVP